MCGRAGGVRACRQCVGVPAVCGRAGRVRACRPCAGVPAVWEGLQVRRVWPRMRAVRQCLRIESASVWSDGCAWRHVDRRRSKSICHDQRVVKRRNFAVDYNARTPATEPSNDCRPGPAFMRTYSSCTSLQFATLVQKISSRSARRAGAHVHNARRDKGPYRPTRYTTPK